MSGGLILGAGRTDPWQAEGRQGIIHTEGNEYRAMRLADLKVQR